jgi:hypothetical protein
MQHIPRRAPLVLPALPWIVIPKPIEHPVPDRVEHRNEQVLAERNPNILHNKIAAAKVTQV